MRFFNKKFKYKIRDEISKEIRLTEKRVLKEQEQIMDAVKRKYYKDTYSRNIKIEDLKRALNKCEKLLETYEEERAYVENFIDNYKPFIEQVHLLFGETLGKMDSHEFNLYSIEDRLKKLKNKVSNIVTKTENIQTGLEGPDLERERIKEECNNFVRGILRPF